MSLKNQILLIALSISFSGAIISMEKDIKFEKQLKEATPMDMSNCISEFARESAHDSEHMKLLGCWLTEQRNNISEANEWNILVKHVTNYVTFCRCYCLANEMTRVVRDIVKEVAQDLQPGQDCSQLLVDRTQEAVRVTTREWKDAQAKKSPYDFF